MMETKDLSELSRGAAEAVIVGMELTPFEAEFARVAGVGLLEYVRQQFERCNTDDLDPLRPISIGATLAYALAAFHAMEGHVPAFAKPLSQPPTALDRLMKAWDGASDEERARFATLIKP